ncbi:UDP-N-acetylmuramoyl-L-alanyl-D-glutamate--2,6-diaminopimelate ligase, partial [Salmonella enterica subsp. enterica]|nr:UDP-N-acetylmuramoyl-L-alanyl-D-glutamate--2,6-diaminopimelate ligase [Salmonella enterica subsp. enterica]
MSITFQDLYTPHDVADWMKQSFQGFELDSRKVKPGQIFIALTSLSQPEKTAQFAQKALDQGALAVISETKLDVSPNLVVADVRHLMGQWQKQYL